MARAPHLSPLSLLLLPILLLLHTTTIVAAALGGGGGGGGVGVGVEGTWCVARSDASTQALQSALDYACSTGADCSPIQANGLCFLPNTIQAHASYAFNSYFQKKAMAPGSCDFSGTANVARSDPSYGSCAYPSSFSAAGGIPTTTSPPTNPNIGMIPTPPTGPVYAGGTPGINPGMTPTLPTYNTDEASLPCIPRTALFTSILLLLLYAF